ncbi:hypothetical protein [Methylobacterium iners]|uniref:HEAT repeat domain-containing protein n=1 Tax=Methylobacterium iners TaxID=418707 RepID=A0ABQ4RSM8_9HYPH|nr:hypothetical protein [Methylobacterium iners]GJD93788.1 hypothetical protein OCOJLMKI_0986 [Methylobacterium iners]
MSGPASNAVLPEDLRSVIERIGADLDRGWVSPWLLARAMAGLDAVAPGNVIRVGREIRDAAGLFWTRVPAYQPRGRSHGDVLAGLPGLEYLFLFHADGHFRQAALDRFRGGARNAFAFVAIAYRLNDWAPPVREAAQACAWRVFSQTDPRIAARACVFLLRRSRHWQRWANHTAALDAIFARADVTSHLVEIIGRATTGPMGRLLQAAARQPALDPHLPDLARRAALPVVRADALRMLIAGRATWPMGFERQWIDKRYGLSRRVAVLGGRDIARSCPLEELVALGAADRAIAVRRAAADGLVAHRARLANVDAVIRMLADDASPSIRERIAFVVKERAGAS